MTNPLAWLIALTLASWLLRRRVWCVFLGAFCIGLLLLCMTPPVAYGITRLWEAEYAAPLPCQNTRPDIIVLLPAGVRKPLGSRSFSTLTHKSLLRLEHALEISASNGDVPILVSGTQQEAAVFRRVSQMWGRESALVDLAGSANTLQAAQAAAQHPQTQEAVVWLVTSALHMRRSRASFSHHGVEVCPVGVDVTENWRGLLPDYRSVGRLDHLLHEVVGMAYYQLRFWLD
ncbi:MAG: ElyC/SanA/YdcF family protein [Pseudomonadota bacterium]